MGSVVVQQRPPPSMRQDVWWQAHIKARALPSPCLGGAFTIVPSYFTIPRRLHKDIGTTIVRTD